MDAAKKSIEGELMWKRQALGTLTAIAIATPATAYTLPRASALHSYCQSSRPAEQGAMMFYVQGILDQALDSASVMAYQMRSENRALDRDKAYQAAQKRLGFCIPDNVPNEVIEKAFCSYLASHPDKLNWPAHDMFKGAMKETWPCQ
jgi:Rap1a immunity proteins